MGGVTGLDYAALPVLFEAYEVSKADWAFYLEKIEVLTEVGLNYWNPDTPAKKPEDRK